MFDFVKEAFYSMALFIEPPVTLTLNLTGLFAWDNCICFLFLEKLEDGICIVAPIRQDVYSFKLHGLQHLVACHAVMTLSGGEHEAQRVTQCIYNRMYFGR